MKRIKEYNNYIKKLSAFFMLMIVIINSGCIGAGVNNCSKKVIYPSVSTTDIQKEIVKQHSCLKKTVISDVKADIHLKLAILYSHYKNTSPDYKLALKNIEKYGKRKPYNKQTDEIKHFSSLLLYINKLKIKCNKLKLGKKQKGVKQRLIDKKNDIASLNEKIKFLKEKNRELTVDIILKKEIIEKLKRIDIRFEKKRLE